MSRSDFCDERAQRMKTLAEDSADPDVRVSPNKDGEELDAAGKGERERKNPTRSTRQICPGSGKKRGLDSVQTAEP
jgi:hypothetical protein